MVLEMSTISQRRGALKILPTDLYNSFQGIINRIQKCPTPSAKLGMRVLIWIHFAHQPINLIELQLALSVHKDHTEFDPD